MNRSLELTRIDQAATPAHAAIETGAVLVAYAVSLIAVVVTATTILGV